MVLVAALSRYSVVPAYSLKICYMWGKDICIFIGADIKDKIEYQPSIDNKNSYKKLNI